MISDVQLSRHTVERRISNIIMAIKSQLHSDFQACEYFSTALDESCRHTRQASIGNICTVYFKRLFDQRRTLNIVPLKDRTCGIDVKEAMMAAIAKANLPIAKLTAIIMDGAPAMIGCLHRLLGLCKADQTFPEFWNFHCIIYREQIVFKFNLDNVMKTVMEIVNYIRTHALNHRQFKNLIAELDQGLPGDLLLHCTVRWLSESQVLSRFF